MTVKQVRLDPDDQYNAKMAIQDALNKVDSIRTLLLGLNESLKLPDFSEFEEAPAPPPEPPLAPSGVTSRFGPVPPEVAAAIAAAWPPDLWRNAADISKLESGWNPQARANTLDKGPCGTQYEIPGVGRAMTEDSVGLFQVNRCAWGGTVEELSDPEFNARKGYEIYTRQGFLAWYYSAKKLGLI